MVAAIPVKPPVWWEEGKAFLQARDPVLAEVIKRFPQGILSSRGAACETLVRAVVGQQISVKAADSIWAKFTALLGTAGVDPEAIMALCDEEMRGAGLSFQKLRYIRGIAAGFMDGTVRPSLWVDEGDAVIIGELVKLPGIGRWTAEMFLIFHLARPDVLPVDDLGLLKGFELLYGPVRGTARLEGMKKWKVVAKALEKQAKVWAPYRSMATWYLWRSLDPVEVVY